MPSERSKPSDISQQIVASARRLFAARGFVGASLGDIAKSVGIRKPSLLYHFRSKDDLRRSVLEDMLARWNEVVPRLLVAATAGPEQFDAVVDETVSFFREDPDRARLMLREVLDRPDEIRPLLEAHVKPWATIVANYIRKGQEHGRVRADVDPQAYVVQMINLVIGSVATYRGTRALLDEGDTSEEAGERILERHLTELVRVAKSSLFADSHTQTEPDRATKTATAESAA